MNWSPQQSAALDAVATWLRTGSAPFFYLAGYAGTGKTTLARHFAEGVGQVVYGSFTGKAASVMRAKGCHDATTIHRLIYESRQKGTARLKELQEQLAKAKDPVQLLVIRTKIHEEIDNLKQPHFELNPDSNVRDADLIIIDECSMVSQKMGEDLLSFGVPVLVLGDPAQLPPVAGTGFFTKGEPDVMLTEVHRHRSGILELATAIRQGKPLDYCDLGDAQVIKKGDLDPEDALTYDQVIVGLNGTRNSLNRRVRKLLGRSSYLPEDGDRLVCLRNNHDLGLLNGEIYTSDGDTHAFDDGTVQLFIKPENGGLPQSIEAWQAPFFGDKLEQWDRSGDIQEFAHGYVLTCHKAQGSQWPRVIVVNECDYFRVNAQRWLYTAITRASEYLTVIK